MRHAAALMLSAWGGVSITASSAPSSAAGSSFFAGASSDLRSIAAVQRGNISIVVFMAHSGELHKAIRRGDRPARLLFVRFEWRDLRWLTSYLQGGFVTALATSTITLIGSDLGFRDGALEMEKGQALAMRSRKRSPYLPCAGIFLQRPAAPNAKS
jgi:hypothetical protein